MANTEIKDKRICIFEIATDRTNRGFERNTKKPVTKTERIWAYVRDLSEKERFAGKAAGVEQSILFKVNYCSAIRASQYVEFKGLFYRIVSVDGFEQYKRDLTIRAVECELPEVRNDQL
jgi:SPP1 family predicted phage head-tail adaptor